MANEAINATDSAIKLAGEHDIDLSKVKGTGKDGRVLKGDVEDVINGLFDQDALPKSNGKDKSSKAADKAELDKAAAEVAKANAKKAKAKAKKKTKAQKEKEAKKKAKEAERQRKREEREAKKKAREEARRKREEEKAKAEAEQRAKDEAAFKQFQKVDTKSLDVPVTEIEPVEVAGAESRTGASMDHLGFITALLLRELPETTEEGYNYEIVDGARRYCDAKERDMDTVPAVVMPADTDEATFAASRALTNLARSSNIVHEAEALDAVMKKTGWLLKDVSKYFDIPLPTLSKTIRILQLPKDFFDATKAGDISASVAMEILNLEPELMDKARTIYRETGNLRVKDIREIRKAHKEAKLEGVPEDALESGEGMYKGTGAGPLGLPLNAKPEVVFEYAAAALLREGLSEEDLAEIITRVASDVTEDAEAATE